MCAVRPVSISDAVADCPASFLYLLFQTEHTDKLRVTGITCVANSPIHESEEPGLAGFTVPV